jgi:hypothetical protein
VIGSPSGRSRWLTLPGLALTNVVPLVLVTQGLMSTPDLLLSYLFELYVLLALWWVQRRRPRGSLDDHAPRISLSWQQRFALRFVPTVAVVWLSWSVLSAVTWDAGTALAVAAMGISIAVGLVLSLREAPRGVTTGAWLWRMLLLATGAWVGLGTAENYTRLQGAGWVPGPLGEGWALPFGRAMAEAGLALGVPAAVVPVLFVVLVRTLNEVLYEAYDILRDADVDRQGSRDALAAMHAERQRQHQQARQRQRDADQGR